MLAAGGRSVLTSPLAFAPSARAPPRGAPARLAMHCGDPEIVNQRVCPGLCNEANGLVHGAWCLATTWQPQSAGNCGKPAAGGLCVLGSQTRAGRGLGYYAT